jgi:hypothetical protein
MVLAGRIGLEIIAVVRGRGKAATDLEAADAGRIIGDLGVGLDPFGETLNQGQVASGAMDRRAAVHGSG